MSALYLCQPAPCESPRVFPDCMPDCMDDDKGERLTPWRGAEGPREPCESATSIESVLSAAIRESPHAGDPLLRPDRHAAALHADIELAQVGLAAHRRIVDVEDVVVGGLEEDA